MANIHDAVNAKKIAKAASHLQSGRAFLSSAPAAAIKITVLGKMKSITIPRGPNVVQMDRAKCWFLPRSQASARRLSHASAAIVLGALSAVNSFPPTCLQAALAKQPPDWQFCNSVASHARRSLNRTRLRVPVTPPSSPLTAPRAPLTAKLRDSALTNA